MKKMIENSGVVFDHYLSSALGEWFATPDGLLSFPLPYEVFLNLLTSGPIMCSRQDFFFYASREDPTLEKSLRYRELKELIDIGKIILIDLKGCDVVSLEKDVRYKRIISKVREVQAKPGLINRERSSFVTNICNLAYCHSMNLPLRFSKETLGPAKEIIAECVKEGVISNRHQKTGPGELNDILKCVFNVEVPSLDVKTEKSIETLVDLFLRSTHIIKDGKKLPLEIDKQEKYEFYMQDYYKDRVFIEAEELLEILKKEQDLKMLRLFLSRISKYNPTIAETRDLIRQEWDKMLGKLSISDWTFTGVNVATSPLPFSGAATALVQTGVNRYLKKQSSWLLTLNEFNKQIRCSPKHSMEIS